MFRLASLILSLFLVTIFQLKESFITMRLIVANKRLSQNLVFYFY